MTLRLYAARKNWPLSAVDVKLTHDKQHAKDAEMTGDTRLDHMRRTITITGDLTQEQRARLLEIADKCPVHKTLEQGTAITTDSA